MTEFIWIIIWIVVIIFALIMMFSWKWINWNIIKRIHYRHSKPNLYEYYFKNKSKKIGK